MPNPTPNSRLQIVETLTDRHVIPIIDIDRPDLPNLVVAASAAAQLTGDGAPTNAVAAVSSTLTIDSAAANSDLTFTAVTPGTGGDAFSVAIIQPVTLNAVLSVEFDGTDALINLPTDGAGSPVAATAAEVKAAWDLAFWIPLPYAYQLNSIISVAVEGDGSGAVDAAVAANLASGVDAVAGTGAGAAAVGSLYVDNTTPALYVNTGTISAPVWTAV
jgi:hypothetical protein